MRVALYARVSTDDKNQNPETQLFAVREFSQKAGWEIVKEYVDHARAKDYKHRTAWAQLLKDARQYDFRCVAVFKLDRAFRSVRECCNQIQEWDERGIKFVCSSQNIIDTTTSMGTFAMHVLAAAAELESSLISERVSAGIRRTRAEGNRYGRKSLADKRGITPVHMAEALANKGSVRGAAAYLKIARSSITRTLGISSVRSILDGVQKGRTNVDAQKTT